MPTDVTLVDGEVVTYEEAQARAEETGNATLLLNGQEVPDPLPVAPPVGYSPGPDLTALIAQAVQRELLLRGDAEVDTAEEAEDFDHPEAFEPFSAYEVDGMSREELLEEMLSRGMLERQKPAPDDAPGVSAPSKSNPPAEVEGGEGGASPKKAPPPAPAGG